MPQPSSKFTSHLPRWGAVCGLLWAGACACTPTPPPGAEAEALGSAELIEVHVGDSSAAAANEESAAGVEPGSIEDNLPFVPNGRKVASIAYRTWIYTDTGTQRTRLGYLRAGAVLDARGPLLQNEGCAGGWLRINPRGFVCLGKGATEDLEHPIVQAYQKRPLRGEGFPYQYAMSDERGPDRYFKLPSKEQMRAIEGDKVFDRGPAWKVRAEAQGWWERLNLAEQPPSFLSSLGRLTKPYGAKKHLEHLVHAGQASSDSGFALLYTFYAQDRGWGITTEMDMLPLDRVELVGEHEPFSVVLEDDAQLPVAFHVRGGITLWRRTESGTFLPDTEQRERRGFRLTGNTATGGMLETDEGLWVVGSTVRVVEPRDSYPSVATGERKWIDISIKDQTLVAYVGRRPVFATLISAGRGGIGEKGDSDPDGNRTVQGTFMIHEKSVSSTMDGDDDRADSFDLQDVPFVQYFHRGFALHGAYWHDDFGRKRSHGCINLAPFDAAWLFEWTDPQVPEGWHAALNKKRGTVVYVHH